MTPSLIYNSLCGIKESIARLRRALSLASVSMPDDDSRLYPSAQLTAYGAAYQARIVYPYGVHANAPKGSACLCFAPNGNQDNQNAIATSSLIRPKGLKEGEFISGNFVTECTLFYDEEGNLKITVPKDVIENVEKNVTINIGEDLTLTVNGGSSTTVEGDLIIDAKKNFSLTVGGDLSVNVSGQINLTAGGDINISAPKTTISGDFEVQGRSDFTTNIFSSGVNIGRNHRHIGVTTGGGVSGGVQP